MKRATHISAILLCALHMVSCGPSADDGKMAGATDLAATEAVTEDTLLLITMPKDALWGHLGEATGMSVMEFITDGGDTLYLSKESEITGRSGIIYGSIRNYTDRFCVTTTDGGETLLKAVNVTQMQEMWAWRTHGEE